MEKEGESSKTTEKWVTLFKNAGIPQQESATYGGTFTENEVEEGQLSQFDHGILISMGVNKVGHRLKILSLSSPHNAQISFSNSPPNSNLGLLQSGATTPNYFSSSSTPTSPITAHRNQISHSSPAPSTGNSGSFGKKINSSYPSTPIITPTHTPLKHSAPDMEPDHSITQSSPSILGGNSNEMERYEEEEIHQVKYYLNLDATKRYVTIGVPRGTEAHITQREFSDIVAKTLKSDAFLVFKLETHEISSTDKHEHEHDDPVLPSNPSSSNLLGTPGVYHHTGSGVSTPNIEHSNPDLLNNEHIETIPTRFSFVRIKSDEVMDEQDTYYVIESTGELSVEKTLKKLQARLKVKDKPIYNSVNNPLIVDFLDPADLYLSNEVGRLGLCMAPGRNKKKKAHVWRRDLGADLTRLKDYYNTEVLVSLIRDIEIKELKTQEIWNEVKKRNMMSIWFPIKDKWIPKSMVGLIGVVEKIIIHLKRGATVVVHCNGGKGRSATVLVAVMVALGKSLSEAIKAIQKTRKGTLRNPLQQAYLRKFKKEWAAHQKRRKKIISSSNAPQMLSTVSSTAFHTSSGSLPIGGGGSLLVVGEEKGVASPAVHPVNSGEDFDSDRSDASEDENGKEEMEQHIKDLEKQMDAAKAEYEKFKAEIEKCKKQWRERAKIKEKREKEEKRIRKEREKLELEEMRKSFKREKLEVKKIEKEEKDEKEKAKKEEKKAKKKEDEKKKGDEEKKKGDEDKKKGDEEKKKEDVEQILTSSEGGEKLAGDKSGGRKDINGSGVRRKRAGSGVHRSSEGASKEEGGSPSVSRKNKDAIHEKKKGDEDKKKGDEEKKKEVEEVKKEEVHGHKDEEKKK
eukprot:TRINITY_DN7150_c0_g1_i1.p1 TRINITY_DN7150_c0_g1~~TRINITY_DN7150_c0_g1_i1.p1  ORF type:complete len:851 (-),score=273.90 TRINITY_DN7150_c0_g1_i1:53-2605(-)